ncbi:MAG: UDP-N-acetylglucosamine 4,6-dehydratase (inverting) [Candidatus Gorgyraea atricola]|nr:UDP-N-acetylglucosamine 4,6-dehydratase (inverting) [Candidatus Gorgyraea atricola]
MFNNKAVLITGGTGSFGKKFTEIVLKKYKPKKVIIYSRDEFKQYEMQKHFKEYKNIRFFIGDVRDKDRLLVAFQGVDFVVHAAALKHVPAMEYNPAEAVKTNTLGAMNIIDAAVERCVKKVIALSTDKACNPINLYGATKLCSDKLFIAGNAYSGKADTRFSVVRYGNVMGSRGSVIPFFTESVKSGVIPITDDRMTRFLITLEQSVEFVIKCFSLMHGGELFVPKIPSTKIIDLARAIGPRCKIKSVGIRPGEKLHEVMVSEDDARNAMEFKDYYIVKPSFPWWKDKNHSGGKRVPDGFRYASNNNKDWLKGERLKKFLNLT